MAVPFDVAADFLEVCGSPGDPESPLTEVTVRRVAPGDGGTLETATAVKALKRLYAKGPVGTGMGGEVSDQVGSFRLWASDLAGLAAALKERDRILDADGVLWDIGRLSVEGFGGFVVASDCVKVRA